MSDMSGTLLNTAVQGLAVVGAVVLLLTFFFGMLVLKTTSNTDAPSLTRELNHHFLIFSAVVITVVALASLGIPLLLALAGGGVLMLAAYRLLVPVMIFAGCGAILYLILQVLSH